jgi:hypothetical protein
MERTFKVRSEGEEPTAAFGLWIELTRDQAAAVERLAGRDVSVTEFLQGIAIEAIEAKIPNIGRINRRSSPQDGQ